MSDDTRMNDGTTHWHGCWDSGRSHYWCAVVEIEQLKAEMAKFDDVIVLLSLVKPDMVMDIENPANMAREVAAEIERLRGQVAELQAWKDAVPISAIRMAQDGSLEFDQVNAAMNAIDAWLDVQPGCTAVMDWF